MSSFLRWGHLALSLPGKLLVALPNGAAVFTVGVTVLEIVQSAAVTADNTGGKNITAAVIYTKPISPSELDLHQIELLWLNDGLVVFHCSIVDFHPRQLSAFC